MTTEGFVSKNGAEGHYHQGRVQSIEGGCPKTVHRVPLFSKSAWVQTRISISAYQSSKMPATRHTWAKSIWPLRSIQPHPTSLVRLDWPTASNPATCNMTVWESATMTIWWKKLVTYVLAAYHNLDNHITIHEPSSCMHAAIDSQFKAKRANKKLQQWSS